MFYRERINNIMSNIEQIKGKLVETEVSAELTQSKKEKTPRLEINSEEETHLFRKDILLDNEI